jgi:putative SOS response-associated peptidase YedK
VKAPHDFFRVEHDRMLVILESNNFAPWLARRGWRRAAHARRQQRFSALADVEAGEQDWQ